MHLTEYRGVEPQQITLVGDSLYDARPAANAGTQLALVSWGYAYTRSLTEWVCPLFGTATELTRYLMT